MILNLEVQRKLVYDVRVLFQMMELFFYDEIFFYDLLQLLLDPNRVFWVHCILLKT
jgi:hypothetical protein